MDKNRLIRIGSIAVAFVLLMGAVVWRLAQLQIRNGADNLEISKNTQYRTLSISGARGTITDANGIALAYDQKSYDVVFYYNSANSSKADRQNYTRIIWETIKIIEKNGGTTLDSFPIRKDETGEYVFRWGDITEKQAARREELWRNNLYYNAKNEDGSYKLTPQAIFESFCEKYYIDDIPDLTYEDKLKILSVWNEVRLTAYIAYLPVTVASNVSFETVADVDSRRLELTGMEIKESTVRVYPQNETASQVLGYTGRMSSQEDIDFYTALGYSQDDLVGVSGVEKAMEEALTGSSAQRQGSQVIEVNNVGTVIRQLSYEEAKNGNDVQLTLNLGLQRAAEAAVEKTVKEAQQRQNERYMNEDLHDEYVRKETALNRSYQAAESGTAVVLDIHTGAVLAMANYPGYDNNLFSGGILAQQYDELVNNPGAPLMNKAISSRCAPGSIFKMVTGIAGLSEGVITLDTKIDDKSPYNEHVVSGRGPSCWTTNYAAHAQETYATALRDSCNYFFFTVSDLLGIAKLHQWAELFGLTVKTNIELPGEVTGNVADQNSLFNPEKGLNEQAISTPLLVHAKLVEIIRAAVDSAGLTVKNETVDEAALTIMRECIGLESNQLGTLIRGVLRNDLNIPYTTIRRQDMVIAISGYLSEIRWNPNDTIVTAIGQSVTTITPIAVARYVAALVNGGTVYDTYIVDTVTDAEGNVLKKTEPTVYQQLDIDPAFLEQTKVGMKEVVNPEDGGTAAKYFEDYKYLDQIGGKTGTAQISNIDLENNAWFVCFAPYDEPEIAVVVLIPNGYSGGIASLAAKDIVQYYLDSKETPAVSDVPKVNTLLP